MRRNRNCVGDYDGRDTREMSENSLVMRVVGIARKSNERIERRFRREDNTNNKRVYFFIFSLQKLCIGGSDVQSGDPRTKEPNLLERDRTHTHTHTPFA